MRGRILVVLAAAMVVWGSAVEAQVIAGTPGTIQGNCIPFGCHDITRYQQIYTASVFGSAPIAIGQLTFFYSSLYDAQPTPMPLQASTYIFRLATTLASVNSLSTTLNDNFAGDESNLHILGTSTIAPGSTISAGQTLDFVGTNPFFYDPSMGNLLLDIFITTANPLLNTYSPTNTAYLDFGYSFYGEAGDFSRAYSVGTGDLFFPTGNYADEHGLVTGFTAAQTVVPEPMTWGLLATGLVGIAGAARRRRQRGIAEDC